MEFSGESHHWRKKNAIMGRAENFSHASLNTKKCFIQVFYDLFIIKRTFSSLAGQIKKNLPGHMRLLMPA